MFEELNVELKSHLHEHDLQHPLVKCPYAYPAFYSRLNSLLQFYRKVEAGNHRLNDWDLFYPDLDAGDRLTKFYTETSQEANAMDELYSNNYELFCEKLYTKKRLAMFGQCWTSPTCLAICSDFLYELDSLRPRELAFVMTQDEMNQMKNLPNSIKVYRGHHEKLCRGKCWYPDREIARVWATLPGYGYLSEGFVEKKHVRALFNRRNEFELYVNPAHVTDIKTSEQCIVKTFDDIGRFQL
ncbi:hypothetical protein [uncultured Rubinisphaera sp.]|uniref:hypothetical protein n=1 Tax=uncultured Rubinisphaera sp. TaxID=1678686 RepID=UPI0030D8500B|tara:strand:- start:238 stop:960 length:723 start_codon:yes stop_codon:yes gene_type:complete